MRCCCCGGGVPSFASSSSSSFDDDDLIARKKIESRRRPSSLSSSRRLRRHHHHQYHHREMSRVSGSYSDHHHESETTGSSIDDVSPLPPSSPLKLSIQDRVRLKSGNRFQSIVCLGTSPRVVHTDEVFVDGEDVFGMHDEYRDEKRKRGEGEDDKDVDDISSELMQKSAFAVEMAVRKIRSTYFAATTRENRHYLVREERGKDGGVINLSIREARLSERLRRRMENEQISQIERMGRGGFPILDV